MNRVQSSAPATDHPAAVFSSALTQRRLRDLHLWLGMLFAPSLLFFAATGALQLFNLHEARPNRAFDPPALVQELGMVHKDQVFALPRRHLPPPTAGADTSPMSPAGPQRDTGRQGGWQTLVLKIFFLLAALGLFASTCLGIWIGLRPGRNRTAAIGLLVAGVVLPVLLLLI